MTLFWKHLVSTALLGTDRQRPELSSSADPELKEFLDAHSDRELEERLLIAAASAGLCRLSGRSLLKNQRPLPEPAPADDRPVCSPWATHHLRLMIDGEYRDALPEWLERVDRAGLRAGEQVLPALLHHGSRNPDLRASIERVIGARGHWLAAQHPEWARYFGPGIGPEEWQHARRDERHALLLRMRRTDPAGARDLLSTTWSKEPAADRRKLLSTFSVGLGPLDEPFLVAALDDRSKLVRTEALDLLCSLPASQLVGQLIGGLSPCLKLEALESSTVERLRSFIARDTGEMNRMVISLPPPEAADPIRRFLPDAPTADSGRFWLRELLSRIPPAHWSERLQRPALHLIQATASSEYEQPVLAGFCAATLRYRSADWAYALLWHARGARLEQEQFQALIPLLKPVELEALIGDCFSASSDPLPDDHFLRSLVLQADHTWSVDFSKMVLSQLRKKLAQPNSWPGKSARSLLNRLALKVPLELATQLMTGWPTSAPDWQYWATTVDKILGLMQFRVEMAKEIKR